MKPSEKIVVQVEELWDRINSASDKLSVFKSKNENIDYLYNNLSYDNEQLSAKVRNLEDKLTNYKQTGENAIDTIKHLESIIEQQTEQINTLKVFEHEIVQLRLLFENTKINLNNSEDDNRDLKFTIEQLNQKLTQIPILLDKNLELEDAVKKLEILNKDFEFSRLEIVRKNKELFDRNNEILQLKDRLAELESKNFDYIKLQKEYSSLKVNDEINKKQVEEVNKHLSMLKEQLNIEKKKYEDKSSQFVAENEILRLDILDLKNQLSKVESQKSEMLDRQVSVYDTLADYRNNIELRDNVISNNKLQIDDLSTKLLNIEFKISEQESLLSQKDTQIIDIGKLNQRIQELTNENEEIAIVKELLDVKDSVISDIKTKLNALSINQQEFELLNSKINELEKATESLKELNEEYKEKFNNISIDKAKLSVTLKQTTEFNDKYKETIEIYAENQIRFEELKNSFKILEEELNDKNTQLAQITKTEEEREMLIAEADKIISRLKTVIEEKELNQVAMETQLTNQNTKIDDLEQSNFLFENEIKYLNEDIDNKNSEIAQLQTQINELNTLNYNLIESDRKIQELKTIYNTLQTSYSELENELISLKQTNVSKNSTIQELNSELERLIKENTFLKDSMKSNSNNTNAHITSLMDENKILNSEIKNSTSIIEDLNNKISVLTADLANLNAVIENTKTETKIDNENVNMLHNTISELKTELATLKLKENSLIRVSFANDSKLKYLQDSLEIKENKIKKLSLDSEPSQYSYEINKQSEIILSLSKKLQELEQLIESDKNNQEKSQIEIEELKKSIELKEKQLSSISEFKKQTSKKIQSYIKRIDEMVE
jgi:chromosome segregation ATPase